MPPKAGQEMFAILAIEVRKGESNIGNSSDIIIQKMAPHFVAFFDTFLRPPIFLPLPDAAAAF